MWHRKLALIFGVALLFILTNLSVGAAVKNANTQQISLIKNKMNLAVSPCVNYHKYACGKWNNLHDNNNYYETIGFIDFKVNSMFVQIFEEMKRNPTDVPRFVKKAYDFYTSCIELDSFEPLRFLEILENQERIPVRFLFFNQTSPRREQSNWINLLAALRKYDLNGLFIEELVVQDPMDSLRSIVDLDMPVLNGGFKPLKNIEYRLVMDYLNLSIEDEVWADFWTEISNLEKFLKNLENQYTALDENDTASTHELEAIQYYRSLKPSYLKQYLNVLLGSSANPHMKVSVQHLGYLNKIFESFQDVNEEFISRYLIVRFIWHLHYSSPNSFGKVDCASLTRSMMPLAMQYLYEEKNPEIVASYGDVEEIFENLVQQFRETLQQNVNNFDAPTLEFLLAKLNAKKVKVGNLPRRNTVEELERFYSMFDIRKNDFHWNFMAALKFGFKNMHSILYKRLANDKVDFFHLQDRDTGANSSPYYLGRFNTVVVPATLLNSPIYSPKSLNVFKYSSLGFLLAHEIVHGFDLSGIMFDANGNIQGPSETIFQNILFDTNLSCLQKKSSKVIDEKIADVSGLRIAYYYFFKNMPVAERKNKLLSSQFSTEKLFFLNFAQFFCGTSDTDYSESLADHGSDQQRLIDALANFQPFAEAYNCPEGSPMNPPTKCHLWR